MRSATTYCQLCGLIGLTSLLIPLPSLAQRGDIPPPTPLYDVKSLGSLSGSYTQAEGVGPNGNVVGQAQAVRHTPPTLVGTPYRFRQLSYFDPNEGYTNRQNIDVLGLVFLLANPRLLRWYYSDRRMEWERQVDVSRGVVFTPPVALGTPVVLEGTRPRELPTPLGRGGVALGQSGQGVVVGAARFSPVDDRLRAACWLPDPKEGTRYRYVDLEGRAARGDSVAASVSYGLIVGSADSGYGIMRAFRWAKLGRDPKGNWTPQVRQNLGTLGGPRSSARAVNARGQIVGWAEVSVGKAQAFLWEPTANGEGAMRPLETPPGLPPGTQTEARAISADGNSIGVAYLPDGTRRAVMWNARGRAVLLPLLPQVGWAEATAVSDLGLVVGFVYDAPPASTAPPAKKDENDVPALADLLSPPDQAAAPASTWAVVWDGQHIRDLNTLIHPRSGWILRRATGITAQGEIIGWGTYRGKTQAFRLTPRFSSVGLPR